MRINKFIAAHSQFSRRKADELILRGKVMLNEKVLLTPGADVDPKKDVVKVNNQAINSLMEEKIYLALNKPAGYITTRNDEQNRKNIMELVPPDKNLKPVGRLDKNTEGLILFTNDGEFIFRYTHPRHEITKEYYTVVEGNLKASEKEKLERGVFLEGKKTAPAKITVEKFNNGQTFLKIEIHEGRKRQIRKMFAYIGLPVAYLQRIRVGKILLGNLPKGKYRYLNQQEINAY